MSATLKRSRKLPPGRRGLFRRFDYGTQAREFWTEQPLNVELLEQRYLLFATGFDDQTACTFDPTLNEQLCFSAAAYGNFTSADLQTVQVVGQTCTTIGETQGSRSTPNDVVATGSWVTDGFVVNWNVYFENGVWNYNYTFTATDGGPVTKDISHVILEVCPLVTSDNFSNYIFDLNVSVEGPRTWSPDDPGKSNPNLPADIYGFKFQPEDGVTLSFKSTLAPGWGDFYAKDGTDPKFDHVDVTAFNANIGTDPVDGTENFGGWIVIPGCPCQNEPPVVSDIWKTTPEDTPLPLSGTDFSSHFTDPNMDNLDEITINSLPTHGTLFLGDTPVTVGQTIPYGELDNLVYIPNHNFHGKDAFDWNGSDGQTYAEEDATVHICVTPVNDLPEVQSFCKWTREDTPFWFTKSDFTSHFTDPDGDHLKTVEIKSLPEHGTLYYKGSLVEVGLVIPKSQLGHLKYVPNENYNGKDGFFWNASDGKDYAEEDAKVCIIICPVNDRPVVEDFWKKTMEDTPLPLSDTDFTDNFTDVDGDSLVSVKIKTLPDHGTLYLDGTPVSVGQIIPYAELNNLVYMPDLNFHGKDSFDWNGSDGKAYAKFDATAHIRVCPVNDAPEVQDFWKWTWEDTPVGLKITDFTSHFSDVDGDHLVKVEIKSLPEHGTLYYKGNLVEVGLVIPRSQLNKLVYVPNENFNGLDQFDWNASDGKTYAEEDATAFIKVCPVNDPPVVDNIYKETLEDTPFPFTQTDFEEKFSDVDGDNLEWVKIVSLPENGTLWYHGILGWRPVVQGEWIKYENLDKLAYAPDHNYNGEDQFDWNGWDGKSFAVEDATVFITILPVNDPPELSPILPLWIVPEEQPVGFDANAWDVEGDTLTYSLVGAPEGAVIDPETGVFTWTPDEQQGYGCCLTTIPYYPFQVVVTDEFGATDSQWVVIGVYEVNQAPELGPLTDWEVDEGSPVTFTVTATDPDWPANTLTLSAFGLPAGASWDPTTGQFSWTPTDGPANTTSVTFLVSDNYPDSSGCGFCWCTGPLTDTGIVHIIVNNVAPIGVLSTTSTGDQPAVGFSNEYDPGLEDTLHGFYYEYDFGNTGTVNAGGWGLTNVDIPLEYFTGEPVVIRGRIYDKDGGFTEYFTTVSLPPLIPWDGQPQPEQPGPLFTVRPPAGTDYLPNEEAPGKAEPLADPRSVGEQLARRWWLYLDKIDGWGGPVEERVVEMTGTDGPPTSQNVLPTLLEGFYRLTVFAEEHVTYEFEVGAHPLNSRPLLAQVPDFGNLKATVTQMFGEPAPFNVATDWTLDLDRIDARDGHMIARLLRVTGTDTLTFEPGMLARLADGRYRITVFSGDHTTYEFEVVRGELRGDPQSLLAHTPDAGQLHVAIRRLFNVSTEAELRTSFWETWGSEGSEQTASPTAAWLGVLTGLASAVWLGNRRSRWNEEVDRAMEAVVA